MPPPFRLLIIILLAFGLSGCDPATDRAATVEFWAMGQEGERVRALLPEFERLHPDIRVRVQQIPWSAAHEKLLTAYAGDSMPDAFQLGNTWIPEFVALRAIEPLDERLRGWPEAALADFFPGILATNRLDDRTYALPWYVIRACSSTGPMCSRPLASSSRRPLGTIGCKRWSRSRAWTARVATPSCCRSTNGSCR